MTLMLFYLFLLLLSLLNIKAKNRYLLFLLFLSALFFSCFRVGIGTDFYSYYDIQKGVYSSWSYVYFEDFHKIFFYIGMITRYDYMYFLLSSCFIFLFLYLIMRDNKQYQYLIFFFFLGSGFYFYSLNGIRQFMAIIVFLYSIKYINVNNKRYYLWIFFACMIHKSAIILFILPFYLRIIKKTNIFFTIPVLCICFIFSNVLNKIFAQFVNSISLLNQYSLYFNSEGYSTLKNYLDRGILVILFIYILFKSYKLINNDNKLKNIFYIFFLGVVLKIILDSSTSRISLYFLMISILFYSFQYIKIPSKNLKIVLIGYSICFYITFIITNTAGIMGI